MDHTHGGKGMNAKHVLIMLLCCLVPLAAVGAVWLFQVPLSRALVVGLMLLCPLSHLFMMWGIMKRERGPAPQHAIAEIERT